MNINMNPTQSFDFTTAILDPRITFARAGNTATVVNSSGLIAGINADLPRFDYDPVTLACRGLLIEETRSNICNYSVNFNGWGSFGGSYTLNSGTAPDGTNTATLVTNTFSGAFRYWPLSVTGAYTVSVWAKGATGNETITLQSAPSGTSTGPMALSTSWKRYTLTYTGTWSRFDIYLGNTSQVAYFWGAQVEAGGFVTSYIPTSGSAVTRNADVATITGTNFSDWWQSGAGGSQVQATPSTVSGIRPLIQFDDGTANGIIVLRGNTTNPELYIVNGGTPQAQIDAGTIAANTDYNLFGIWKTNDCAAKLNNGTPVTDTSATIPTVTQVRLGADGSNYLNGHLTSINYYTGNQIAGVGRYMYTRRKNKVVPPSIF